MSTCPEGELCCLDGICALRRCTSGCCERLVTECVFVSYYGCCEDCYTRLGYWEIDQSDTQPEQQA